MRIAFIEPSSAQQYPDHHITMVVPFTAASRADTISRILAPGLTAVLGQQVIVVHEWDKAGRQSSASPPTVQ
jgi:tripartite-type tricarboxylate transporter receptor subunit TctC